VTVVPVVFSFHKEIVNAFENKDESTAAQITKRMLSHGAEELKKAQSKE
jgi:DNA-binding FadR family transcriptional regulator